MKLFVESLQVESFEVAPAPTDSDVTKPVPWTQDRYYHSLCVICYETDRTMCARTCEYSEWVCVA